MSELIIRDIGHDDDFAHWFHELLQLEDRGPGHVGPTDDRYLVLSNEIGDWIGGVRFSLRGGVAQLVEIAITHAERHQGHAHRLLVGFEQVARDNEAHLAEFWTDDLEAEGLLSALGWSRVLERQRYMGNKDWVLMEKRLGQGE